ncbi:WXG100 family type VII secretion target [Actinoallomurus sp. CA-150999]|uniref:WXG100 family type VII secretion target n=1 Tax=Actinoallomurus sp. CA-150999 TaxID=3239887 RepID=UPI003D8FD580
MDADYDHVQKIALSLSGLNDYAKQITQHGENIKTALDNIITALTGLQVDWAGPSQQEHEDVSNRFDRVSRAVLGSKERPEEGVINAITHGLGVVGSNYGKAEAGLVDVWNQFAGKLGTSSGKQPTETPPDQMDTNKTAITADYPPLAS